MSKYNGPRPSSDGAANNSKIERLLTVRQVCSTLSVSDRWIRRAMAGGWFPLPDFRLNRTHGMRWKQSTIETYLQSRTNSKGVPTK